MCNIARNTRGYMKKGIYKKVNKAYLGRKHDKRLKHDKPYFKRELNKELQGVTKEAIVSVWN